MPDSILRDVSDPCGDRLLRVVHRQCFSAEFEGAPSHLDRPIDELEHGRAARAHWSRQPDNLPCCDLKVEPTHDSASESSCTQDRACLRVLTNRLREVGVQGSTDDCLDDGRLVDLVRLKGGDVATVAENRHPGCNLDDLVEAVGYEQDRLARVACQALQHGEEEFDLLDRQRGSWFVEGKHAATVLLQVLQCSGDLDHSSLGRRQ